MKVSQSDIGRILKREAPVESGYAGLGLLNSGILGTLSFIDSDSYLNELNGNNNIKGVFITDKLLQHLERQDLDLWISEDPRYDFFYLMNELGALNYKKTASIIDNTATIHPTAFVSEHNVKIGENTVIGPNVTILPDVEIGRNCLIQPGAVVGSEGFEYKRTSKGILPVRHDGKVILKDFVEIGSNACIDKGFSYRDTIIGTHTKIDNLIHIAHSVQTGKGCFIIASAMIAGSVTLEDNVWIGPNANIAPHLTVSNNGFVTLGSVVTKNVKSGEKVTGNFAIDHQVFLNNLKRSLKSE